MKVDLFDLDISKVTRIPIKCGRPCAKELSSRVRGRPRKTWLDGGILFQRGAIPLQLQRKDIIYLFSGGLIHLSATDIKGKDDINVKLMGTHVPDGSRYRRSTTGRHRVVRLVCLR